MVLSDISSLPERITGGSKMCHINCLDAVDFVFVWSSICLVTFLQPDGNISMLLNAPDLRPSPQLLTSLVLPVQLCKRRKPNG